MSSNQTISPQGDDSRQGRTVSIDQTMSPYWEMTAGKAGQRPLIRRCLHREMASEKAGQCPAIRRCLHREMTAEKAGQCPAIRRCLHREMTAEKEGQCPLIRRCIHREMTAEKAVQCPLIRRYPHREMTAGKAGQCPLIRRCLHREMTAGKAGQCPLIRRCLHKQVTPGKADCRVQRSDGVSTSRSHRGRQNSVCQRERISASLGNLTNTVAIFDRMCPSRELQLLLSVFIRNFLCCERYTRVEEARARARARVCVCVCVCVCACVCECACNTLQFSDAGQLHPTPLLPYSLRNILENVNFLFPVLCGASLKLKALHST